MYRCDSYECISGVELFIRVTYRFNLGGESWNHIIALISSCFELTNTGDCVNSSVAGILADYLVMSRITELEREC